MTQLILFDLTVDCSNCSWQFLKFCE